MSLTMLAGAALVLFANDPALPPRPTAPVIFAIPIEPCPAAEILADRPLADPQSARARMTVCLRQPPAVLEQRFQRVLADLAKVGLKANALQMDNGARLITTATSDARWEVFMTAAPGAGVMEIVVMRSTP